MRILHLSDIHGLTHRAEAIAQRGPDADLITVSGDITHFATAPNGDKVLEALAARGRKVYFVTGNCDLFRGGEITVEGAIHLHGLTAPAGQYILLGFGWGDSPKAQGALEPDEEEVSRILREAIKRVDDPHRLILLIHPPPSQTKADDLGGDRHVGSDALRAFIEEFQPLLVLCGHIHEGRGVDRVGATTIVNPGPAKSGFYAIVSIHQNGGVDVELANIQQRQVSLPPKL